MALCVALPACSKPAAKTHPVASASASSAAPTVASTAPAPDVTAAAPHDRAPVPRDSLQAPPLMAPADAIAGPGGVRVQILNAGTGDSPTGVDSIVVDFSMWTGDGHLAFSSYPEPGPAGFSVSSLPLNLRSVLTQLKVGSKARLWVPRAALAGWKPPDWPDADLVFDLELLKVAHVTVTDLSGNHIEPLPFQPPDGAGPPKTAAVTRSGLHYVYLQHGAKGRRATAADHLDLNATAYVIDGIEVKTVGSGIKTATTLARAPGNLSEVLSQLSSDDRVRIWLPKGQGLPIIPEAGTRELILDVSMSFQN